MESHDGQGLWPMSVKCVLLGSVVRGAEGITKLN